MRTEKKTRPISSADIETLYDASVGGKAERYSISVPKSWSELTDAQLRYVYTLLAMGWMGDTLQTYCLMRWAGFEVEQRRTARYWLVRHEGKLLQVDTQDIASSIEAMDWLGETPDMPVRIGTVDGHEAIDAQLHGLSFGDYIRLENYYQGYLLSKNDKAVAAIAEILYPGIEGEKMEPYLAYNIIQWMVSLKKLFGQLWPDFFRPASADADGTPPDMRAVMVAEIRALTGGDVTKNSTVLATDTWDALTELNEKAREAREFNEKMKK